MNVPKINHSNKIFRPLKICVTIIAVLGAVLFWQFALITRKNQTITSLASENSELKKSLSLIDEQLVDLKDTASDVRIFQRELIRVMKNIDQNYPVNFAKATKSKSTFVVDDDCEFNAESALNNAHETIFKLSSSHENLRFETANLLGRALSIKDILDKTPSMRPVSYGTVTSDFGTRHDPFTRAIKMHQGIDIAAPIGTSVVASADGRVKMAERNLDLGYFIQIEHADGFVTVYGHMSKLLVRKGQEVKRGQEIGHVGNTGLRCRGAHLHFEISKNGQKLNPKPYLITLPWNTPHFS